ncbi:hypothetical protein [Corynebacterium sp. EPI-003-04-2554_SCH2473622]|uniref:hypothetical protein n=1 Tax=Corynebacterium sp. EPI-003-04-2554_SCH2473622 TaxID=1834153 RepID=UPI0007E97E5D|nr:hypothetical protein [Corynebacterium sp. EPI-003-04-2554_SCH2473622]OBA56622.1 hypothetical protein A5774_01670 [Corynebacterium sp. EPI-003-04-2554_SCH2473622]
MLPPVTSGPSKLLASQQLICCGNAATSQHKYRCPTRRRIPPNQEAAPVEGAEGANLSGVDGQGDAFASADGAAQRGATSANYKPTSSSMSFFSGLILGLGVFAFALGIGIYVVMWQRSRNK